jgi:hypothetical protein
MAFDLNELPRTLSQAIAITRKLGFQYLWIGMFLIPTDFCLFLWIILNLVVDSLCIRQDSIEDWEKESSKMASIYRGSELNLSASAAQDGDGGCILKPEQIVSQPGEMDTGISSLSGYFKSGDYQPAIATIFSDRSSDRIIEDLTRAPFNKRGWVLQETIFAPRIVHFTATQLIWQCREFFGLKMGC